MLFFSHFSRILSVLITLFLFTSPSFAQNCPPLESNSPALEQSITTQFEYIELEQPIPTVATRSQTFWGNIGDWFTKAIPATVEFAIGMVPIVGTGIDCVKGAFHLATNQDVDLFETELGCIGMSFDALVTAATLAGQLQVTVSYPILKPIMFAMKVVNRASIRFSGAARTALIKTVERLGLARSITAYRNEATKLITRISNAKFTKGVIDESGENAGGKALDDTAKEILESCKLPFSRQGVQPLAVQCGLNADDYWDLVNQTGNSLGDFARQMNLGNPNAYPFPKEWATLLIKDWSSRYRINESQIRAALPITDFEEWILKELGNFTKAADRSLVNAGTLTEFFSPGGLRFKVGSVDKTRVLHVIEHSGDGIANANKSIFANAAGIKLNADKMFEFLDNTWTGLRSGRLLPKNPPSPRSNNICIDFGKIIGVDNNNNPVQQMVLALNSATFNNTSGIIPPVGDVVTAFPIDFAFDLREKLAGNPSFCH